MVLEPELFAGPDMAHIDDVFDLAGLHGVSPGR
jgi:hypothetical protein